MLADEWSHLAHVVRHRDFAIRQESHLGKEELSDLLRTSIWLGESKIVVGDIHFHPHFGRSGRLCPVLVIVVVGIRHLDLVFVQLPMLHIAFPATMRSLVVAHYKEWLRGVALLDEIDCLVCDDIGHISSFDVRAIGVEESGIKVLSLTGDDFPSVKAPGLVCFALAQVPLADHCRLVVAVATKLLGDVGKTIVDG